MSAWLPRFSSHQCEERTELVCPLCLEVLAEIFLTGEALLKIVHLFLCKAAGSGDVVSGRIESHDLQQSFKHWLHVGLAILALTVALHRTSKLLCTVQFCIVIIVIKIFPIKSIIML